MSGEAVRLVLERLKRETGVSDLAALLAERLSPSELTSLLLEVSRRAARRRTPADVLARYERDRLSRPALAAPGQLARFEVLALERLAGDFEAVTLSPVCPLGTSSAVAGVPQDWAVTTNRASEVVSDATNVLALEVAARRRSGGASENVHLAAHHRLLRPQFTSDPLRLPHFALLALVSGGRAGSGRSIEHGFAAHHLRAHLSVIMAVAPGTAVRIVIGGPGARELADELDTLNVEVDPHEDRRAYYAGPWFRVFGRAASEDVFLVDGGEVDWTRKLLSNAKERLFVSGLGSERLVGVFGF